MIKGQQDLKQSSYALNINHVNMRKSLNAVNFQ